MERRWVMNTLTQITVVTALVLSFLVPFGAYMKGERNKGRYKKSLVVNVVLFFGILVVAFIAAFAGGTTVAQAAAGAEGAAEGTADGGGIATGLGYLAAALVTGMSCIGGGIAVSSAASAALGAISEDSSILGKSLIFVGLAEGVALYGLIISFMILGKL